MGPVHFHFELISAGPAVHGLAMGHLAIHLGAASVSSRERDQPVMIFLSVTHMLDAVRKLVTRGGSSMVLGVDSSFEVGMRCDRKKATIVFHHGKSVLGEASDKAIAVSLWQEAERFVSAHRDNFDRRNSTSAAVFDDLFQAMHDFEAAAH